MLQPHDLNRVNVCSLVHLIPDLRCLFHFLRQKFALVLEFLNALVLLLYRRLKGTFKVCHLFFELFLVLHVLGLVIFKCKFDFLDLVFSAPKLIFALFHPNRVFVDVVLEAVVLLLVKFKFTLELFLSLQNHHIQICETVFKLLESKWLLTLQTVDLLKSFDSSIGTFLMNLKAK